MQQIKLFHGIESELRGLEDEINAWLRESGARVISISGNVAPQSSPRGGGAGATLTRSPFAASDVLVIVLYETS